MYIIYKYHWSWGQQHRSPGEDLDLKQENERKPKLREKEEEHKKQPSSLCTSLNALSSRALIFNGEMKGLYIEPGFEAVIYRVRVVEDEKVYKVWYCLRSLFPSANQERRYSLNSKSKDSLDDT